MKSWASGGFRPGLVVLAIAMLGWFTSAQAAVGRTPGTFNVSSDGAAIYSIPIFAPRGSNDLEPHIALTYDSQNGNGDVGVGWGLAGLSSIVRCAKTFAQDGQASPIQLQTSDGYCLDGQRLRVTSGASTYGAAGSTYQTEIANFSLVTANGSAGNGPGYWEVQGRDGRTYEYGSGGNSQVLANGTTTAWQWWLDKVVDRSGNTLLTISYSTDNATGTVVPNTISWTPSGSGYAYTMVFNFNGTNTPQSSIAGYVAGTQISNTNLLQSISVSYNGGLVKEYFLSYTTSPNTNKEELSQVKECADQAQTNCLAPTTFSYNQNSASGVSSSATTLNLGGTVNWWLAGYDLTGSGYHDLVYQIGGTWYVAFGTASGYGTPVNTGITTPAYTSGTGKLLVGDLLGTGQDGLLANNGGNWWYYTWNGSGFAGVNTGLAYNSSATAFALADTTGNGLPSLVELLLNPAGLSVQAAVYIVPNTSSNGTPSFGAPVLAYTNNDDTGDTITSGLLRGADAQHAAPIRRLDFDGDKTDDLMLHLNWFDGVDRVHIHETFQLLTSGTTLRALSVSQTGGAYYFFNWNDSACTDYSIDLTLYISACNGNPGATYPLPGSPLAVIDWNGDGRQDLLYDSSGTLYVQPTTGTGLGTPFTTGIAFIAGAQYGSADIVGDKMDDLLTWTTTAIAQNMHDGQGGQPIDTLDQVMDGYGNSAKPAYVSLVQGSGSTYTTVGQFDLGSGEELYYGPMYVVSRVTYSDPSNLNATYTRTHYYDSAAMSLSGYGFSGFLKHQIQDSRNTLWETYDYQLLFPRTGLINSDILSTDQAGNHPVSIITNSPTYTLLDSTTHNWRYFVYNSGYTQKDYELDGIENGALISTTATSYSYDSDGAATQLQKTITDNDPSSPYVGDSWTTTITNTPDEDTGTWCLGLLSQSQVSYSASNGSASVTRTRNYTPDLTLCRYTQIVTEPSSPTYAVTEALTYDSFGNVNSDSITGVGMSSRVTKTDWGATGQFPMIVTDALNEQTKVSYDFRYGLVSSEVDPNLVTTSWAYGEGFGRLTQETRPDGTYTTWNYNDCTTYGGCLIGAHTLALAHFVYNTDGSIQTDGTTYYDELERPVLWNNMMLSGGWNQNEQRYDSLGRVAQRAFPCLWSGSVASACPNWTTLSYDGLNRVTAVQRPISQSDSTLETTTYGYEGRTTTITDPQQHTKTLVRDVNGWLRQTKDALGYNVTLGYDAAGSRTAVTDSLGNTLWAGSYAYGVSPFLVTENDVDLGAWTYTPDALGERTKWTDAKGKTFYESYDVLSRPISRVDPDLFTHWTWGNSAASHNIGKLQTVCTGTGYPCSSTYYYSETETYDSLGRLSQRAIAIPAVGTSTYTWQYNATTGLLDTLTYPVSTSSKALQLKYAYHNGFLQSITDVLDSPNVTVWQANAENPAGQVTQETLGNGLVTSRAYDAVTNWLQSVQSGPGGGTSAQNQSFLYDEVGNVTQRQDNNHGLTENFYYDSDDRLSYSTLNGTQNLSLSYNAMGNVTSRSDVASGATWTYDPVHVHEVTQAGSTAYKYTYDANGNMASRQGNTITWASYNYPTAINDAATGESVSFSYGPDRNAYLEQTQTSSGTEVAYHIGGMLDVVTSGSVTDYRHYIYAGNEPVAIASRKSSGTNALYYLLSDHQGSIAAITNSAGAVLVNESFTAYGSRRNPTTWSGAPSSTDLNTIAGITRHGYTFQSALASQMALNDMVGRVQDAVTGRLLSADPYVPDITNAQSYNSYSYVNNSPLTYIDPSGFDGCNPGDYNINNIGDYGGDGSGYDSESEDAYQPRPKVHEQCNDTPLEDRNYYGSDPVDDIAPPTIYGRGPRGDRPQLSPPPLQNIAGGPKNVSEAAGGHDYRTHNIVCNRPLTPSEQRDLLSRFSVPSIFDEGFPAGNGEYLVTNSQGIPGGFVQTTFSPDGLAVTNVTTPVHAFVGTVVRSVGVSGGSTFIDTHGFGDAGDSLLGQLRDENNQAFGPGIFDQLDSLALRYAAANLPGCL